MIAFTADNHLGVTSQWSIKERKDDFLQAFRNITDRVISCNDTEKALLVGGDLFDTAYPPSFAVEFAQNEVRRLRQSGCQVFGIDGNHDIADGKWLRVCGITPLSEEAVTLPGGLRVCGLSYRRSSSIIDSLNAMADRGVTCDILLLHLAFGELNRMGAASDLSASDILPALKTLGVRFVLMGHIHIRQSVTIDGITFAYCGSSELCSMNEPKQKSFDTLDLTTGLLNPVPIATRKIVSSVIGNEKEYAAYAASVEKDSPELHSVYVAHDLQNGVKRLRELAKSLNVLMRVQVLQNAESSNSEEDAIDRTTGIIGLEQAIGLSFPADSAEADLIRSILRAPESLKLTIDNYINKE